HHQPRRLCQGGARDRPRHDDEIPLQARRQILLGRVHQTMIDLYCFGDSITYGGNDSERGGWVDRLKVEQLARGGNVFNLGIGGEPSRGIRPRFESELGARFNPDARSLITLGYGGNDAASIDGKLLVPEDEYRENLAWAIERARGCEVFLVNVTPVAREEVR